MNWGYRIIVLILGFMCFMTFMVVSAFKQNFDLVAEDYYGKELKFESQIEKQKNQHRVKEEVSCVLSDSILTIAFPRLFAHKKLSGNILFFRPSDAKKDITIPIESSDEGGQELPLRLFSSGKYILQVDYTVDGIDYYSEQTIMIR